MARIGNAPSGEKTSSDGTEKLPISGNQWMLVSRIAAYIATLTQTLTGKTVNLSSNTLTGTTAQFNTANSDGDFATLAGSETLTNKTITAPTITAPTLSTTVALTGIISPSQITSNQNDYNPTSLSTATVLRLNSDASRNITGLQGGASGRVIIIENVGSNAIVLKDEDSGSSAANRFALTADVTLSADSMVVLKYDSTSSRWRAVAGGGGSGANSFGTVAVSGQSDVVADAAPDTLTLEAGSGITLTTDASTDKVTIAASGTSAVLNVNTTPVGNVGSGEDDLITCSISANTLDTNGQYIHFKLSGTFAATVANKRIRIKIGSTTLFDTGALAITAAGDWSAEGDIVRTGSATQRCRVEFSSNETALTGSADYVDATEDLTTALTLKATGEATNDNDIIQKFLIVEKGGGSGGGVLVSDKKTLTSGDKTTTGTSFADVDGTNMVITLTTGARRCKITFTGWGTNSSGAQNNRVDLSIDGSRVGGTYGMVGAIGTNNNFSFSFTTDILSAGSHTFKPQWCVDGGTGTLYASSVSPLIFSVEELPDVVGGAGGGASTALVSDKKTRTSADYTTSSTSFVDVDGTNVVITLTTGARRCLVNLQCWGTNNNVNQNTRVDLNLDGSRVGGSYGLIAGIGTNNYLGFTFITDVLSAGSHTFKPQWSVDGGTGTLYASSTSPLIFSVVELPLKDPS